MNRYQLPIVVHFEHPYSNKFAYGADYINSSNEKAQTLIRCLSLLMYNQNKGIKTDNISPIKEIFSLLYKEHTSYGNSIEFVKYEKNYTNFLNAINDANLLKINVYENLPQIDDFVPGTLGISRDGKQALISPYRYQRNEFPIREWCQISDSFGKLIT